MTRGRNPDHCYECGIYIGGKPEDHYCVSCAYELREEKLCGHCGRPWGGVEVEWTGTAQEVNRLPELVRQWVHELEARCDPAGDLRARRMAEDMAGAIEQQESKGVVMDIDRGHVYHEDGTRALEILGRYRIIGPLLEDDK